MYLPIDERQDHQRFHAGGRAGGPLRSRHSFVIVPSPIVRSPALSRGAKVLYFLLKEHAWQDGECFPSQLTLAELLPCSVRSIRNYLAELVAEGLVIKQQRGLNRSNRYILPELAGSREKHGLRNGNSEDSGTAKFAAQERQKTTLLERQKSTHYKDSLDPNTPYKESPPAPPRAGGQTSPAIVAATRTEDRPIRSTDELAAEGSAVPPSAEPSSSRPPAPAQANGGLQLIPSPARAGGLRRTEASIAARKQERRDLAAAVDRDKYYTGPHAICRACGQRPCCCGEPSRPRTREMGRTGLEGLEG